MSQSDVVELSRQLKNIKFALDQAAIVAVTDQLGSITYGNNKFYEITGYTEHELIGKTHRVINSRVHSPEFFHEMWKTISSGKIWKGEICNRTKAGKLYWVDTTIVPLLGTDGKPQEYISIRFEITRRKEVEEMLAASAEKLAKSNRELEEFASIAAHDLQEPLRKIQAFSERIYQRLLNLVNRVQEIDSEAQEAQEISDYLKRMRDAAQRMQNLILDLLTYSRVTTQVSPFARVDLNEIIAEVISDLEVRIEQSQGEIQVAPLPSLQADRFQIRQLFQNLISNALKFHKKGIPPRVSISASIENQYCEIHFQDEGIGFDEKYLARIFTVFQRLHGKHEYEGTGVGLAVCRRIVERHEGSITAKSSLGAGANFIVRLPIQSRVNEVGK